MVLNGTVTARLQDGLLTRHLDMKNEFKEEISGNKS